MKRLNITVPVECDAKIVGFLYDEPVATLRSADMIEILLPNGVLIEAGWHPEGSAAGSYLVTASLEFEFLVPPMRLSSIYEVRNHIEFLIRYYCRDAFPTSKTGSSSTSISFVAA